MKTQEYSYIKDGFEAVLYDAENGNDRLLIVIQGLKGLELPTKYAEMFAGKKNIMSGCFISLTSGKEKGLTKKRYRSKKNTR